MSNPKPFVVLARVETMQRDWNRLRDLIRQEGTPDIQEAWDKCERWLGISRGIFEREKSDG